MARATIKHGPASTHHFRQHSKQQQHSFTQAMTLHERIIYPAPKGPRPPRILHSPAHAVLDPLFLDLIALICREHILSWYSAISSDPERAFIQQVTAVLIHVIQALEVRLAHVDLVQLLVVELPALLEQHISDFDEATFKARSGHAHNLNRDQMFHHLQPHIAIHLTDTAPSTGTDTVEAVVDKTYLRALVENVLRLLLPPEDYRAETERAIVRELISNTILGGVFTRVAQPWFSHQLILRLLEKRETDSQQRARDTENKAHQQSPDDPASTTYHDRVLKMALSLAGVVQRVAIAGLSILRMASSSSPHPHTSDSPSLYERPMAFVLRLLPPSSALQQLAHYTTLLCRLLARPLNQVIYSTVDESILTTSAMQSALESVTNALFPGGHPPPKEPDPTPEEQVILREKCERALAQAIPARLTQVVDLPESDDKALTLARYLLRPVSSQAANVHLIVLLIDKIVGLLFPEMTMTSAD